MLAFGSLHTICGVAFPSIQFQSGEIFREAVREVVVPGVHSDVGCGYSPVEQGKGIDKNGDDVLSRIPFVDHV